MSAFFFGTSERPLFGFYHQPTIRPVRPEGVVLCNAMGEEYLRTHRTQRQLAARLAERGFHVLRFDYSGTGDSAGDGEDVSLERWRTEVSMAADELEAMTGVRRVSLVGVRVGGALAAVAAAERPDVEDVALWDPVVRGSDYLKDLLEEPRNGNGAKNPRPADRSTVGIGGFPIPAGLRDELEAVDLSSLPTINARRALLVVSEEKKEHGELADHLARLGPDVRIEHRPGSEGFENPGRMGNVVLVPAIVGTIVDFLERAE